MLARLLPGQLNPLGFIAGADGVPRLDCWQVVVALVRELRPYVGDRPVRVAADAYFRKASFLNPLLAQGITVISRLRQDAVGRDDPARVVGKRPRGRPRQKGRAWKLATLLHPEPVTTRTVAIYGKAERLRVVWRAVWLREGTHPVRVVVVATRGDPILLVSTDVTLPPEAILQLYAARFSMELALRDWKQDGGLGDYQGWTWLAMHRVVHLALTACCLWRLPRLQDQQATGRRAERATPAGELSPLSVHRLHRALRRGVLQQMFATVAPGADSQQTAGGYEQIVRIAV